MEPPPPQDTGELGRTRTLIERAQQGDLAAREELFALYAPRLQRFLHARLPPAARPMLETQDLVQDVALRAAAALERFEDRGIGSFWAFLRTVGRRRLQEIARGTGSRPRSVQAGTATWPDPASPEATPHTRAAEQDALEAYDRALEVLEERERWALSMRLEMDLDYATIAGDAGYPSPDAARMAVRRALDRVTAELSREPA